MLRKVVSSHQMRTTLNIDEDALLEVRRYAEQRSISLGESATSLIFRGAASQPEFRMTNGWALLDSVRGAPPLTNETVKQLADEDLDAEEQRAFSPGR